MKKLGQIIDSFLVGGHAAFGANLVVLWGTASLCISAYKDALPLMWVIPLLASPVGILLLDDRQANAEYLPSPR